jgi:hypothetical protein
MGKLKRALHYAEDDSGAKIEDMLSNNEELLVNNILKSMVEKMKFTEVIENFDKFTEVEFINWINNK